MRVPLKELLEKLGVKHILSAYETHPWVYYDEDQDITVSAEVRMGPSGDSIETELQFLEDDNDDNDDEGNGEKTGGTKRKIYLKAKKASNETWSPCELEVEGNSFVNEVGEWEEKGCALFKACVQAMQMGELPDLEELVKRELTDDSMGGRGGRGKIGRKSPKVRPEKLLGMKKGGM